MERVRLPAALGLSLLLAAAPAHAQGGGQSGQPAAAASPTEQGQSGAGGRQENDQLAGRVAHQLAQTLPQTRAEEGGVLSPGWKVQGSGNLEVSVRADDGDITLGGRLPSIDQVRQVVEAARQVPGVRSVRSEIAFYVGVPQERLESYVGALQEMSQAEPRIRQSMQQGQLVGQEVLGSIPGAELQRALGEAGISQEEFRRITQELQKDQALQQRYAEVARQQVQQSGGEQSPSGGQPQPGGQAPQSGAPAGSPAASPQ